MEFHLHQLVKHCRVYGNQLCKAKSRAPVFDCNDFKESQLMTLGVDVSSDDVQVCLTNFCNPGYTIMRQAVKASKEGMAYTHTIVPMIWTSHAHNCPVKNNYYLN